MPKTAFAGVMLDTSFARFMASIATFNEEGRPPRSFGRWDLLSMNQSKGTTRIRCKVEVTSKGADADRDAAARKRRHLMKQIVLVAEAF